MTGKSSLRHLVGRRVHLERHQPGGRANKGLLEKKQDYRQRAKNFHDKEKHLANLRLKAALKNSDEFNSKMVSLKQRNDGKVVRRLKVEDELKVADERNLADTRDLKYVTARVQMEQKAIEKLENRVLLRGSTGKRTVFRDDSSGDEKVVAKSVGDDEATEKWTLKMRKKVETELLQRKERLTKFKNVQQYLQTQKEIRADPKASRTVASVEGVNVPTVYKYKQVRKK